MSQHKTLQATIDRVHALCPDKDRDHIREHLEGLGERYIEQFDAEAIARRLVILDDLSPNKPCEVLVEMGDRGHVECTFLTFDAQGLFSLIAGLLTGMGLDIQSGHIFTSARPHRPNQRRGARRSSEAPRSYAITGKADTAGRRRVIDHFCGIINTGADPDQWAEELRRRAREIIALLENRDSDAARNRVHEWVTSMLERLYYWNPPALNPIELTLDNTSGPYTRMRVISEDTPVFLYALSNALSLKGVSIERVVIETRNNRIVDEFDFTDQSGRRIEDEETLRRIRMSVLFTKQFTYFLPKAPDPYGALTRFNQLLDDVMRLPEQGRWIDRFSQTRNLDDLARILGASDYIWEDFIRLQIEQLAPILDPEERSRRFFHRESLEERLALDIAQAETYEEQIQRLNTFKDHEIFLIDMDNILRSQFFNPRALAEDLTCLAEVVLQSAYRLVSQRLQERLGVPRTVAGIEAPLAVLGLGKMGGTALGYASDIELIFVYSDQGATDAAQPMANAEYFERFVQEFKNVIHAKREGIFELDLQLRPYGKKASLACSLETFCKYFGPGGEAHAYERLALVRLRAVAGDAELGARVERLRDEFIYFSQSIDVEALRRLRERQYAEKTAGRVNAKFSPGALVDVEYDVQILQITHGRRDAAIRSPRTHAAIEALCQVGVMQAEEGERLGRAYYFLRHLINGLRMLRGNARDLFLPSPDSDEYRHLARRMGYERKGDLTRSRQLRLDFETHTAIVRAFVEKHFGRESLPDPTMGTVADIILSDQSSDALARRALSGLRLANTARAVGNLKRLGAWAGAQVERFAMLAVLACDMLQDKADPDMALNNWERFVAALPDPKGHFETLLAQPKRLDVFLSIVATSQFLADTLVANPDFFDWATSPANIHRSLRREEVVAEMMALAEAAPDHTAWLNALRVHRRRGILRIGTKDICLGEPIQRITGDLSILAESCIAAVLQRFWEEKGPDTPADRFCILAFGKLGGQELNYSSDIDLLAVCDGPATPVFQEAIERVREDLSIHLIEGTAYRVDLRLRPYGTAGPLVQSVDAVEKYYRERGSLWEIQALLKLRPIAGATAVGDDLIRRLRSVIAVPRPRETISNSIDRLRQEAVSQSARRAAQPFRPRTETLEYRDVKNGKGGIRDIEFLVQGLQFMNAPDHPDLIEGNTLKALTLLTGAGLLPESVARKLETDYVFLRRVEHLLQIMEDQQTHSLPESEAEMEALARRAIGPTCDAQAFQDTIRECQEAVRAAYRQYIQGEESPPPTGE